jgi:hypothetical protein
MHIEAQNILPKIPCDAKIQCRLIMTTQRLGHGTLKRNSMEKKSRERDIHTYIDLSCQCLKFNLPKSSIEAQRNTVRLSHSAIAFPGCCCLPVAGSQPGGMILGQSPRHPRRKYKLFFPVTK